MKTNKINMHRKNTFFVMLLLAVITMLSLVSCGDLYWFAPEPEDVPEMEHADYSSLDELFVTGFTMQLEQIYVMPGAHTIPYLDKPVEELFVSNQTMVNLVNFQTTNYTNEFIMYGLRKNDRWVFKKMVYTYDDTTYVEHGYGSTYMLTSYISKTPYTFISSDNPYNVIDFVSNIHIGNPYNYRGHDNYTISIYSYSLNSKSYVKTNLVLTVLTKDGNGIFDGQYIYFDTNDQVSMAQRVTAPLTGQQVAIIVASGSGYEIYPYKGYNCIKIGTNLYIPTIGNTYGYIGTSNDNGLISGYSYKYFRLKFKILKQA
ncbi:MAG: hypothetical protein LBT78_07565 [Tannerella sp.]|nr:hypothetical protein [Tannerella sp.]